MKPTTPQRDENGRGGFVGATWQVAPTEVPICDDCGYFQGRRDVLSRLASLCHAVETGWG
jgi:hypothetical protein